jgi:hypothetical protein
MRTMGMKVFVLIGTLFLGACSGLQSPNPDSPYYAYPPGWVMRLNRPLQIEPGAATARLQYGRIVPRNSVQEQDPFCIVEVNTVSAEAQLLQPGRFDVVRVTRRVSAISTAVSPIISPGYRKVGLGGNDDSPTFLYFITEFRLRDPNQPNLRSVRCAWNQMAPGNRSLMRDLTLDEIRSALGDWITLIPPTESL